MALTNSHSEETEPLTAKHEEVQLVAAADQKDAGVDEKVVVELSAHVLGDPLVRQLPKAMLKYVVTPQQNQDKVNFVERVGCAKWFHYTMACCGGLLCGYSCCRMSVVQKGEIALTQYGDEQEILSQGRHVRLVPWNVEQGKVQLTEPVIKHGTIHIIKVQSGQLGYGVDMLTGHPKLLTQGEHTIDSDTFLWQRFITLREPRTMLANLTIVRIETGYVGYCYKQGQLVILQPGLHLIQPPDRFGEIITTQMTILELPLATHETSDYVPLAIKAAVFYRIADPLKALVRIQNISKQIQETSTATLAGIIRGSSLADVASQSTPFYHHKQQGIIKRKYDKTGRELKRDLVDEDLEQETAAEENKEQEAEDEEVLQFPFGGGAGGTAFGGIPIASFVPPSSGVVTPSAPPYFQHVHDEFMQQLHAHVLDEWGIEIQNIRIESLKIADAKLQTNISSQAIKVSDTHNKYMLLMKEAEIVTVQAETEAKKIRIDTEAEAERTRTRAQAAADAVVMAAEARKKAKELEGAGEMEYSRLLESTKMGTTLASMKLQADAIGGLEQIAFVPHLPGILERGGVFGDQRLLMPSKSEHERH